MPNTQCADCGDLVAVGGTCYRCGASNCGFCKGKPVHDAATWLDGKPRPPLPCPRCGETNYPDTTRKDTQ